MSKFLNSDGVKYLWGKIKEFVISKVPTKVSQLTNDSNYITLAQVPEGALPSSTAPKMDGTATVGSEATFARGDHVHPHDTTKVDKETGKGLSTNDYSTAEKNKLAGIAEGANNYSLPTAGTTLGGVKTTSSVSKADGYTPVPIIGGVPYYKDTDTTYDPATSAKDGLMAKADKAKLDAFGDASTYALKSDMTNVYKYKGSVASKDKLPSGATAGDVYNCEDTGMNYAWTGTTWDALGEIFTIDALSNDDIDALLTDAA